MNEKASASLVLAAAALFVSGCSKGGEAPEAAAPEAAAPEAAAPEAAAGGGDVKCLGVNECKGQGQCGIPGAHACAGQNECKGKGWLKISQAECDEKGGSVLGS